jgi:hypothetical protein
MINLEADAAAAKTFSEEDLSELARHAAEQLKLERDIKEAEDYLKALNDRHHKISEEIIPNKMMSIGMSEFKLISGQKISIKRFYSASISDENRVAAFDWLESNGHTDIIKHLVTVPIGRGEDDVWSATTDFLKEKGIVYTDEQKIHPQTLKAFVKEQVETGSDLPLDTFKVYIGNKSIIK